ncbi:MAG: shikimate kinase [Acidimicrobiales bacterium mtb01]|nr:shikimate kinase [Actinomycetota bacterium]TEX45234.1 MAG: shikimate kinase [Acidimicrobiales bacterium mtb01]
MTVGHIVLIGLMGSGKTTVGRKLASVIGRRFVDTDEEVERRTGRTVREIFETDGEQAFRLIEHRALADTMATPEPLVVAAAGGAVLREDNRSLLGGPHRVVWLKAEPELLIERVGRRRGHRPLLDDDPDLKLRQLWSERDPIYRSLADDTIDVSDKTVDGLCSEIAELLA